MRVIFVISFVFIITSCGGSLSDEQREALKKEMEKREIKKVSEEEIFNKAQQLGRGYVQALQKMPNDSLAEKEGITITWVDSATSVNLQSPLKELWDAYAYSAARQEAINDNVQAAGDSLIYSFPRRESSHVEGVWFIKIPRKKVVLEL